MAIPTPSFFKIRLTILIIGFVVLCFVIGFVKEVFAETYTWATSPCKEIVYTHKPTTIYVSKIAAWYLNAVTGELNAVGTYYGSGIARPGHNVHVTQYYWTGIKWQSFGSDTSDYDNDKIGPYTHEIISSTVPYSTDQRDEQWIATQTCTPCKTESELLTSLCGGQKDVAWRWVDEATCSGDCIDPCQDYYDEFKASCEKSGGIVDQSNYDTQNCSGLSCTYEECTGPGEETQAEAQARCNLEETTLNHYDGEACLGICGCSKEQYLAEKSRCDAAGISYFSEVTCLATCNDCQQLYNDVKQDCEESGGALTNFNCQDTDGAITGTPTWDCVGAPEIIEPPGTETDTPPELTPDTPEDTTPETTNPAPDPQDPPANPWDGAIKDELENQTSQLDKVITEEKNQTGLLKWLGDVLGTLNNNIGKVFNQLKATDSKSGQAITKLENTIDDVNDTLSDMSEGKYTGPGEEDPYATDEYSFGDRTSQFLNNMKSTGLFSIPNTLSQSIPGGGSSTLTISTGPTFGGDHTIDFNWLSAGLTTLKYLFQIAGMVLAIRIVTLKR